MSDERIRARYWVETPIALDEAVDVMAGEQSSGTFVKVPGESEELSQRHRARVESMTELEPADTPSLPGALPPRERQGRAVYARGEVELSWVPETQIAGKVGYAVPPGGASQMAVGFSLSVSSNSDQKELAYLFIQWLNSQEISTQRVQLPYALRDPFRDSHYESKEYKSRWDDAPQYLQTMKEAASVGLLDLSIVQTAAYEEALQRGISRLWGGGDPQEILDDVAADWNEITERVGVERQRKVYKDWASKPNAYP